MLKQEIKCEAGKNKVRIKVDSDYRDSITTCTNGWQFVGITLTEELAEIMMQGLVEYLQVKRANKCLGKNI